MNFNLTTISTLMGHSKVATTLHYLRNVELDDESSEAFKKLGLSTKKNKGSKGFNLFEQKNKRNADFSTFLSLFKNAGDRNRTILRQLQY